MQHKRLPLGMDRFLAAVVRLKRSLRLRKAMQWTMWYSFKLFLSLYTVLLCIYSGNTAQKVAPGHG